VYVRVLTPSNGLDLPELFPRSPVEENPSLPHAKSQLSCARLAPGLALLLR
ncbi:hypothetical protein AAVH_24921, partial [Aphelenchoides avenae]